MLGKRSAQVVALYGSMLGTTVAGMVVSIFNTRTLSPEEFSDFRIVLSALNLLAVLLPIGTFYSAGRLFAQKEKDVADEDLRGWVIVVLVVLLTLAALVTLGVAPWASRLFGRDLSGTLLMIAPLAGAFLMQGMLENQLQGENRILGLAIYRIAPSVSYFCFACLYSWYFPLTTASALFIQLACVLAVGAAVTAGSQIRFRALGKAHTVMVLHVKSYGVPVYLGALASVAVAHTAVPILGYFVHGPDAGFFALAQTMSMPLTILGGAIGTSSFKYFSSEKCIPVRFVLLTFGVCVGGFLAYQVIIAPVFHLFYGERYEAALPLARIMALGYALHGCGDFFNRFLCAHGQGVRVRNGAFFLGGVSLSAYLVLAGVAGAQGAAIAVMVSSSVYLGIMALQYRRYVHSCR